MDAREVGRIASSVFDAKKYALRTHVFVKVLEYDADNNAVTVQQIRKAIRFTDAEHVETVELPPLSEVIVRQVGSGKLWLTVAPQPDTYGYLHISDRDVDHWREAGGKDSNRIVEPADTRCMDVRDAVFEPSLVHLGDDADSGKFMEPIKTDRISMRTRSGLTEISVLDDESITVKINDGNATVIIDSDGHISITAAGDLTATADGDATITASSITLDNGTETAALDGADFAVGSGSGFASLATVTDNKIQAIADAIAAGVATPTDGGAGLQSTIMAVLTPALAALGSVASANLKAD